MENSLKNIPLSLKEFGADNNTNHSEILKLFYRNDILDQPIFSKEEGQNILMSSHIIGKIKRIGDDETFPFYENIFNSSYENLAKEDYRKKPNGQDLVKSLSKKLLIKLWRSNK